MKKRLIPIFILAMFGLIWAVAASLSNNEDPPKSKQSKAKSKHASAYVSATVETDPVPTSGDAADDIAIWIHPTDVSLSTIIGAVKSGGGLAVYNLDGSQIQYIDGMEPNNVDLRYNFMLGGVPTTLVCFSEQDEDLIGVYAVNPKTRLLYNVAAGEFKPDMNVYGFAMYYSASSAKYYCFVNSKSGAIEQWELFDNGRGRVDARLVRSLSVSSQTEGLVADDFFGYLYVAEEDVGIWRFSAEPTGRSEPVFVDGIAPNGKLDDDVEGLTIYYRKDGSGYLIASSQGADEFVVYERTGSNKFIASFEIVAGNGIDEVGGTDGIDVSNFNLGPLFPKGVFVVQDGKNETGFQNFKLVPWDEIARATKPPLIIDTDWDPRLMGASRQDVPSSTPGGQRTKDAGSDSFE